MRKYAHIVYPYFLKLSEICNNYIQDYLYKNVDFFQKIGQ